LLRCRITKPGFRTITLPLGAAPLKVSLDEEDKIPAEMVRIAGGQFALRMPGPSVDTQNRPLMDS
jgi:hypothetical protein